MTVRFTILAAIALLTGAAEAQPEAQSLAPTPTACTLDRVASSDIVITDTGLTTIGGIGRTKLPFLLDTRLPRSTLFEGAIRQQGLPESSVNDVYVDIDARPLYFESRVPSLDLGGLVFPTMGILVAQRTMTLNGQQLAGVLGADLLRYTDVEIDPKSGKLNLYSQDHCEGKVVYWAKEYFVSPLHIRRDEEMEMDVELDGQPLHAVLSTGIGDSLLQLRAAAKRFGLDEHSPGMVAAEPVTDLSGYPVATYHYPFKTLKFGELTINNPTIRVAETGTQPIVHTHINPDFTADLLIGMNFLKKFHLYLANKEDKVYYTIVQ